MLGKIGKYEIRKEIGRGAMGAVYEGFDTAIGRRVAIKVLRTDVFNVTQLPEVMVRFRREAQAAGGLSHPNIVTIHDYGEEAGTPYIVMEYIMGSELGDLLDRGTRFTQPEIVRLMTQLLGALAAAHAKGVVHRDLKPANIFLLEDRSLKVVDFGIARLESSDLTDTGTMLGTPAYMSPEQCLGTQVDYRSDLYSAGVILYQLLTGEKPFTGSVTSIIQKVLRQEPLSPSELNPTIAPAWDPVVARAMAKQPEARFASTHQFADAIRAAAREGVAGPSSPKPSRDADETIPIADTQLISSAKPPPAQKSPAAGESAPRSATVPWLLALLVAAAGAGYYFWQRGTVEAPGAPAAAPVDEDALRRSVEARVRREYEERALAEKAAAEKAAAEKAAAEKAAAEKAAAQKAAVEKAAADKAAADKAAADKAAARQRELADAAAAKLAADRAAARAAADRAAAEKAAAARATAEKAAAEQAAAAKRAAELAAVETARRAPAPRTQPSAPPEEPPSPLDGTWTGGTLAASSFQCPAGRFSAVIRKGRVSGTATYDRSPRPSELGGYVQSEDSVVMTIIPPEAGARASRIVLRLFGGQLIGEDAETCSIGRYNISLARD